MIIPSSFLTALTSISLLSQADPPPTAQNCSVRGYDIGKHPAFLLSNTTTTAAACKAFCAANVTPKCVSFAVGTPGGCLLYNVTVASNVNVVNGSAYTFYDAGCTV